MLTVELVETWHGDSLYHLPGGRRHQRQCLRHPATVALPSLSTRITVGEFAAWYNLARVHQALRAALVMDAGLEEHIWPVRELLTVP